MKTIKLLGLFAVGVLAFSSCKNNMSLTKRHYTKGYYFHKSKAVDQPEASEGIASKKDLKTKEVINPIEKIEVKSNDIIHTNNSVVKKEATTNEYIASTSKSLAQTSKKTKSPESESLNETKQQLKAQSKPTKQASERGGGDSSTVKLILCVILAIFIPPLGMYIWNKKTDTWFIVDLILFLLLFTYLFWSGGLVGLAAVVIALLRVFDII